MKHVKHMKHMTTLALSMVVASVVAIAGCDQKPSTTGAAKPATPTAEKPVPTTPPTKDGHDHAAGEKHDGHDHAAGEKHDDHGHGPTVELGTQTIGVFGVKASRDGDVVAGKDAPIDVWVTVPAGAPKVAVVRFWVGTRDAKGSVKAKAELEKENYHTHVEVPSPLPAGSKLWVEIETDKNEKVVGGFELKAGG